MLFNKNDDRANERVLYTTKPNMILGCKKAIYGIILLAIVFFISPIIVQFIGEMQVYLISYVKLSLTRYTAIGFFVVILVIILYIIWQLISWHSVEYTLTDTRIIIKSGVLSTKRNYMPYTTIQDINTSQSIFARLFNVGTVSAFSAYDNNQIKIENISNPSKVEDIIFSNMMNYRSYQEPANDFIGMSNHYNNPRFDYDDGYYDDYEPITPIGHERNNFSRREYEYYPEEFGFEEDRSNKYEYEPYGDNLDYRMDHVANNSNDYIRYESGPNNFSNDDYYNEVRDNYSYSDDSYYQNNKRESNYIDNVESSYQNESENLDDSSETVIRRHFDKFKK